MPYLMILFIFTITLDVSEAPSSSNSGNVVLVEKFVYNNSVYND